MIASELNFQSDEKIEDLQIEGLKIIQNKKWFCFGMDAVLLSDFADIKKHSKVVDLGTGTGIIPLLLWAKRKPSIVYGIEIQKEVAEMAKRSILLNGLEESIKILNADMLRLDGVLEFNSFDAVVTNPPYIESNGGIVNPHGNKALSRHEISCCLEDVIKTAAKLLKQYGSFYMIHRPYRLVDIMALMRQYKLEPKKMRLIHPRKGEKPNMVLIKGVKLGNPELTVEPPLYIYDQATQYTEDIYKIYGLEKA